MTKLRGIAVFRLLPVIGILVFATASVAQQRPPVVEKLTKTYGLDEFGQIEAIRYTFNLQLPGVNLSRSWEWEPKTGKVSYDGKDKDGKPVKVSYQSSNLANESDAVKNDINASFINDQYWLIFPFHVSWDTAADVQDKGMQKLPLGTGTARRVVVKYPNEGGYTPGDTWELFVGKDDRVEQMVYRRGGPKKPSLVTVTWAGHKKAGPLLVSTEHRGTADGKPLRIFFSNVSVKRAGSDKWEDTK